MIDNILCQCEENTTLHISALEVYFDDCFDLLDNKVKVPIAGFGKGSKATTVGTYSTCVNVERDSKGKWVPPYLNGKKNVQ